MTDTAFPAAPVVARRTFWGLSLLFGALYFVQGLAEPSEGLIAQPVRSLLKSWGRSATEIGAFAAVLSLPWAIKPLYGLCTDLFPWRGQRRRPYLIVTTGAASLSLLAVFFLPLPPGAINRLLAVLLIPTIGVAFSDVVADALMVEAGRKHGLTGKLQAMQWSAMYGATILAGWLGGYLSQTQRQSQGFLICSLVLGGSCLLTLAFVREAHVTQRTNLSEITRAVRRSLATSRFWAVVAFVFLWNFNPFSTSVLYLHMTEALGFSEQFYGSTVSVLAFACMLGSAAYGLYCRRVPFRWLIHLSIVAGVASTLAYWGLYDERSAQIVAFIVGGAYITGTLVTLDLAARHCDPTTAGTTFALLMSVSNLGISLSSAAGGYWYDRWSEQWGTSIAFQVLVGVGAGFTALCWFLVPWLQDESLES